MAQNLRDLTGHFIARGNFRFLLHVHREEELSKAIPLLSLCRLLLLLVLWRWVQSGPLKHIPHSILYYLEYLFLIFSVLPRFFC